MSLGYKVRNLRIKHKMSQEELSHELGISQATLLNIENENTKKVDVFLMDKICKLFEVDFDHFLGEQNVNNFNDNIGGVVGNSGVVNLFPENIINQIKELVEDNKLKEQKIKELESLLNKYNY